MKNSFLLLLLLFILAGAMGCKKFDAGEQNQEELITTLLIHFSQTGSSQVTTVKWEDLDGPGGNPPIADSIHLLNGQSYLVNIQLWNKAANPAINITQEIEDEKEAHRFYYIPNSTANANITTVDEDANTVPVGIHTKWAAGAASAGKVHITLRHYPGTPPDKQMSDPVNSPKSATDISVEMDCITH